MLDWHGYCCGRSAITESPMQRNHAPFHAFNIVMSVGLTALSGCMAETMDDPADEAASPDSDWGAHQSESMVDTAAVSMAQAPDSTIDKVFQGLAGGARSIVGLNFRAPCQGGPAGCFTIATCTGALVSGTSLLTAAHCIDPRIMLQWSSDTFLGHVAVTYWDPDTNSTYCLSRTGAGGIFGACNDGLESDYMTMAAVIPLGYTGGTSNPSSDTEDDVALIFNLQASWPSVASTKHDWARVAFGSTRGGVNGNAVRVGDRFLHAGFGHNSDTGPISSGVLRYDPDQVRVDWVGSAHFYNNAGSVRVCKGDSGSSALVFAGTVPISLGVLSNTQAPLNPRCAVSGTKQRWSLNQRNISWIRATQERFGVQCTTLGYIVSYNLGYSVLECT
jgi:hypothetical protein